MESNACCFCGSENELSGRFFEDSDLAAHQFCLYFSSGLAQNGRDDEGFDGFLASDIKKELSRTRREKCTHCGKNNASIGCSLKRCRKVYHYQCGYANNAQFVFRGRFNSYCADHRERQDTSSLLNCSSMVQCPVCLDEITVTTGDTEDILKMPCCRNFAHKTCLQQTAYASGYFFKCPYCSDKFKFEKEMIRFGIFIPQRDAAWEEEEGAYAELLETYTRCDNPVCKCPQGREHSQQEGLWRCIRCHHCGQSAVHNHCLGRHRVPTYEYVCINCTPTNQQQQTSSSSKSSISNKSSPAKSSISKKNSPAKSSNSMKTSPTKPHQRSSPSKILKPCQSSSSNRQSSCVPTSITALQRHENTKKEKALHINYLQPKKPVNWRKYDIRECRVVVKSLTEEFIRKHLHSTVFHFSKLW